MKTVDQMTNEELMAEFASLGQGQAPVAPTSQPFRTDITQATGRGSSEKFVDPVGMKTEAELKNEIEADLQMKKEEINQIFKARTNLDEYTSDAMQALIGVDKLSRHAEDLGDFDRGFLHQTYARLKTGIDTYGKEKNVTRYLGVLAQELIPFARKLMEEKGPITEFDVARVEKGLGDLTTPLEDKKYLLNELKSKVGLALKNKMQSAQIPEGEFRKKYSTLSNMAFSGDQVAPTAEGLVVGGDFNGEKILKVKKVG